MAGTLAVISQTGESLSFFDVSSGKRTAHIDSVTSEPHELCYDAKRKLLYMSHTYRHGNFWSHGDYSHEISVVDVNTKSIVGTIDTSPAKGPHGLQLDPTGNILYASVEQLLNEHGGGIIGIDLTTRQVIKQIPSSYKTHWFTMTPDGEKAYCCNKTATFISVLDLEKERMIGKIDVPGCEEPSMSIDGRYAYFPTPGFQGGKNAADPKIQIIDTTTDKIVKSINMKRGALPVHVSPDGLILVGQYHFVDNTTDAPAITDLATANLAIYEPKDCQLLGEVPIGLIPLTIRCSSDGKTAFVANVVHGTVSVIDIESKKLIRTLDVDNHRRKDKNIHVGAHGVAFID